MKAFLELPIFWKYSTSRLKILFILLSFLVCLVALSETLTLRFALPFFKSITATGSPGQASTDTFPSISLTASLFSTYKYAILFVVFTALTASLKLTTLRFTTYLSARLGSCLTSQAYYAYFGQDYLSIGSVHSSKFINVLTSGADLLISSINAYIQLISSLALSIAVSLTLIYVTPFETILSLVLCGGAYITVANISKSIISRNSNYVNQSRKDQIKLTQETIKGIKDFIMANALNGVCSTYSSNDLSRRTKQAQILYWISFPRYFIEAFAVCFLCVFTVVLSVLFPSRAESALAILATIAVGFQKLLPQVQQIYASRSLIKTNRPAVSDLLQLLTIPSNHLSALDKTSHTPALKFKTIELRNVSYSYSTNFRCLKDVSLEINSGEIVAIIGESGSGKSTLIDILMGLISPDSGQLLVDDSILPIFTDPHAYNIWRSTVSFVNQHPFICNASILQNIILASADSQPIDTRKVDLVCQQASLSTLLHQLPEGLNTIVTENGSSLSGGQKQRLALARALYKNANLLILDEVTSALDPDTKTDISKALISLKGKVTIIIVTHDYENLSFCDKCYRLDQGSLRQFEPPYIHI